MESPNPFAAEAPIAPLKTSQVAESTQDDGLTAKVIPYKNPKALTAYYLGLCSGLPLIGLPLGIASFVLGIQGLQARQRDPAIHGSAHAWIGIGCGGFFAIFWSIMLAIFLFAWLFVPIANP